MNSPNPSSGRRVVAQSAFERSLSDGADEQTVQAARERIAKHLADWAQALSMDERYESSHGKANRAHEAATAAGRNPHQDADYLNASDEVVASARELRSES